MRRRVGVCLICGLLAVALGACRGTDERAAVLGTTPAPLPPRPTPDTDVLYLNLLWHQHQPLYYKDETGVYTRPWVRVHATKDYYDMAYRVSQYPGLHVTFNLTPVLLRQLDDFAQGGARDAYWALSEKPASSLTEDDKRFLLERFFDANWTNVIGRFPRYQELLDQRGGASPEGITAAMAVFDEQDFRDLQVWFNLAWFDPMFLEQEPLRSLVERGRDFSEGDKSVLFGEASRILREVVPLHRKMQEEGQIEVITSPYAHPILPLLYNTKLALMGNPEAEMPDRFSYPNDAIAQLDKSVEVYQEHFGRAPVGLWPSEGAVAEEIVSLVSNAGYRWMASGEQVLAQSLGLGSFTRDSADTVLEADKLYRPYYVQGSRGEPVMMVFRDMRLSDMIGFEYSQTPGPEAANDLLKRLGDIQAQLERQGAEGPHLVSIILDGENAWEYYPNDGEAFLDALYSGLSTQRSMRTVTPHEYLEMFPEQRKLEELYPGAWFSPNFDTWIGEPEERAAWEYLLEARQDLSQYDMLKKKAPPSPAALQRAQDYLYLAEGSDWFWWYGADQSSGNDDYFDKGFRALLGGMYEALGEEPPPFVRVPITSVAGIEPTRPLTGTFTPQIDGAASSEDEWAKAATYFSLGGVQARSEDVGSAVYAGFDSGAIYLRLDLKSEWTDLGQDRASFYLSVPGAGAAYPFRRLTDPRSEDALIGFAATHVLEVSMWAGTPAAGLFRATRTGWSPRAEEAEAKVAVSGKVLEAALPLASLGDLEAGDAISLSAVISRAESVLHALPEAGPAAVTVPDLGQAEVVLSLSDPEGDDHGPGSYTYPTDPVFEPQVFDLKIFTVSTDGKSISFIFDFFGPVPNPWGSPNSLALQTLDVYVDKDPLKGTGARLLLPGRNASLVDGYGWEYAVWAEGWTPQFVGADASGTPKQVTGVEPKVIVDRVAQRVTLRVPLSAFGEGDPSDWAFAAAVLSQDGFPSPGVWRVRDVKEESEQWRLGGGTADTNHTRILDLAWPEGSTPTQEEMLSSYPSRLDPIDDLSPADFAQVRMLQSKSAP